MSSSKKIVVVVGATGAQGYSVVTAFLGSPSWHIRALTRSPSSDKAKKLSSAGVEVVGADANDPSTLFDAFRDAHAIFAVTDFWTLYGAAASDTSILKPGQLAVEYAFEKELQQGKNFFDVAATIPSLERFVFSSLAQPSKWSKGKYTYGLHFEAKGLGCEYGRTTYPDLWRKTSVIQLGFYLENMMRNEMMKPTKTPEGDFVFTDLSTASDALPMVSADIDTGIITKALIETLPAGKNVAAYREWMSLRDYAVLWGQTLEVPARAAAADSAKVVTSDPGLIRDLKEVFAFSHEFGYYGGDPSITQAQELGKGVSLGTVKDWIISQDWSELLGK